MNIGFLYGVYAYPPSVGGSVHGYQLAKGLTERKHRLYTWYYGNRDYPYCEHFSGRELIRFLRRIDALYIRVEFPYLVAPFKLLRLLFHTRLPTVYEFNALPDEVRHYPDAPLDPDDIARRLRRLPGRRTAAIGVTEGIRRYLDEEIGFARTYCIPNGSDPHLFAPRSAPSPGTGPLKVVWIGQTSIGWHDFGAIIGAAELLARRRANVVFHLYGDLRALPQPLPANVEARGLVPYEEIGAQIAEADAGLHVLRAVEGASRLGISPLKVFDYMACGLAVIAQGDGQAGAIVRERTSGLITSGTAEDLADKIQALEADRARCRQLGRNGRRAVEEYYNWDRVARDTERVLADLLA